MKTNYKYYNMIILYLIKYNSLSSDLFNYTVFWGSIVQGLRQESRFWPGRP